MSQNQGIFASCNLRSSCSNSSYARYTTFGKKQSPLNSVPVFRPTPPSTFTRLEKQGTLWTPIDQDILHHADAYAKVLTAKRLLTVNAQPKIKSFKLLIPLHAQVTPTPQFTYCDSLSR